MAGGGASAKSSKAQRLRKRVEAESSISVAAPTSSLRRAKDGSAFAKCEECNKDVPVALISFHNCSLDAKIKMNLESQVVEMAAEAKKKPTAEKRKAKSTDPNASRKEKRVKNSNAPKRPPTAFFLFMKDFRGVFKEANPDCKNVAMVGKEAGEKWKSMTDEEKKPYFDRAAELKAEYLKALESNDDENEDEDRSSEKEAEEKEVEGKEVEEEEVDE